MALMPWEVNLSFWEGFAERDINRLGRKNDGGSPSFEEWDKTHVFNDSYSESGDSDSEKGRKDDDDEDAKTQEELLRTTQLVYSKQSGKMVPRLREPRQLYGFTATEFGPQQQARWPAEIQVLPERIKHIPYVPSEPEPFYKRTGMEKSPMARSHEDGGKVVFQYEPIVGGFFMRSRVGGARTGCATLGVDSDDANVLTFESRFESGNLAKAVKVGDYDYELWLRNDLYTSKHTQWYYFRVGNTKANKEYRFTIVNLMKPDSLYNDGMRTLMYSEKSATEKKIGWVRAGENFRYYRNNIKFTQGKSERSYYSLTWTCKFAHDDDVCYFAHCYPYTYSDMQDYLNDVANDPVKSKICKSKVLCRTLAGNLVYVLTITSPTKSPEEAKHRKGVVITSRVHPGESNSSWMMKGFLDYLLGNTADAKLLRDTFIFKIVPMLNPDGVIVGNYRCSLTGRDLNRNYKTVLKDSFPSVWYCKNMIKRLSEEREIVAYCDLHGHSRKHNVFIYGCENRGNPQRRLRERVFPLMLNKNDPDRFCFESCKFKIQKSKEGTGRIVMWNMGIMNSYTMEATFAGSSIGKKKGFHFNTADFEAMGFDFCDTLLDYCDPDNSKTTQIMAELEERMRAEILQHLKQTEGDLAAAGKSWEDINLDDYTSEVESSDGGSDSSVSDGLPAHLQYQMSKVPKKKRLKSKKERDKKKALQATPITSDRREEMKVKSSKVTKTRAKPREDRIGSGLPIHTAERSGERRNSKPSNDGYLEALTNAYLRSGILANNETSKDMPHFRYTGSGAPGPIPAIPIPDGAKMCAHHQQAFAAQYVASHLQQYKFPDDIDDISKHKPGRLGSAHRTSENSPAGPAAEASFGQEGFAQEPGRGGAGDPMSPTGPFSDRKLSHRHIVELSTAQARQREMEAKQSARADTNEDVDSPIKQHPPPFDAALLRENAFLKRGESDDTRLPSPVLLHSVPNSSHYSMGAPFATSTNLAPGPHSASTNNLRSTNLTSASTASVRGKTGNPSHAKHPSAGRPKTQTPVLVRTANSGKGVRKYDESDRRDSFEARTQLLGGSLRREMPNENQAHWDELNATQTMTAASDFDRHSYHGPDMISHGKLKTKLTKQKSDPVQLHAAGLKATNEYVVSTHEVRSNPHPVSADGTAAHKSESRSNGGPTHGMEEMQSTMRSIHELRQQLLDPNKRANLSPTTGRFVDHFVRKTDAEISDIVSGYSNGYEIEDSIHSNGNETLEYLNNIRNQRRSSQGDMGYQHQTNNQSSSGSNLYTRNNSANRYQAPTNRAHSRQQMKEQAQTINNTTKTLSQTDANNYVDKRLTSTVKRLGRVQIGDLAEYEDEDVIPLESTPVRSSSWRKDSASGMRKRTLPGAVHAEPYTGEMPEQDQEKSALQVKRFPTSPTKISLMITRNHGHNNQPDFESPAVGQFHAQPLGRSVRSGLRANKRR